MVLRCGGGSGPSSLLVGGGVITQLDMQLGERQGDFESTTHPLARVDITNGLSYRN